MHKRRNSADEQLAPPITQIHEAAHIIGVDLSLCASHPKINHAPHMQLHTAPKEEWLPRWLLKKLELERDYHVKSASFLTQTAHRRDCMVPHAEKIG